MQEEAIIFYHLPKTAGTTLNGILKQNYAPQRIVESSADTHAFVADMETWPEAKFRRIKLLKGHFPFGVHTLFPQKTRCFTLLRDPVERVISYYYHAVRNPNHYLYDLIHDNDWSLEDLMERGIPIMMNDAQVRLISGVWGEPDFGKIDETILETAVENLRSCAVVGLTEKFDDSILLLQNAFGWANVGYKSSNLGTNRPQQDQLSASMLETIKKHNLFDQLLYEEAKRLFAAQSRQLSRFFQLKVVMMQMKRALKNF